MAKRRNRPRKNKGNRTAPARIEMTKNGAKILCPYCYPPHQIITETPASCGTVLELVAVQNVFSGIDCALCGESGGTLIKIGETYRHDHDCTPGKTIFAVPPPKSMFAAMFWRAPKFLTMFVARRYGRAATKIEGKNGKPYFGWDMVRTIPMKVTTDGQVQNQSS